MPIKRAYRERTEIVTILKGMICNACGKEADIEDPSPGTFGFHKIHLEGGYGDAFPGDMERFEIVVCEDCLQKWVSTFQYPDVVVSHGLFGVPIEARHSETLADLIVEDLWIRPAGTEYPSGLPDLKDPPTGTVPEEGLVWEHFKGRRYIILGLAWDVDTKEPHVVYQGLYGDSDVWVRPLTEWSDTICRGLFKGPRFKKVSP